MGAGRFICFAYARAGGIKDQPSTSSLLLHLLFNTKIQNTSQGILSFLPKPHFPPLLVKAKQSEALRAVPEGATDGSWAQQLSCRVPASNCTAQGAPALQGSAGPAQHSTAAKLVCVI